MKPKVRKQSDDDFSNVSKNISKNMFYKLLLGREYIKNHQITVYVISYTDLEEKFKK